MRQVLGQSLATKGVLTDLYTVTAGLRWTTATSLMVCNQGRSVGRFRVAVAVAGAADTGKQYLYYDTPVFVEQPFAAEFKWELGPGDVVRVQSDSGLLSFNLFGDTSI